MSGAKHWIDMRIDEDILFDAARLFKERTLVNTRSATGNYILENKVGALGEAIAMYGILTLDKPEKEMYDYDLVNRWNGATIDVKAQTSNTPPKSEYIIRLTLGNHRHQVDHYVFVWIKRNWKQAWILGQLTPVKFFKTCKRINEGEVSPINGHKQRLDCLALSVNDLDPIEGTRIVSHE